MHNYTVPSKYKHQTRLGNWSEEWELEETKMKDYLKSKEQGSLQTVQKERKLQLSLQKASLTYSTNGFVQFSDHLMFANDQTQGYLAVDINERIGGNEEGYSVTTANNIHPCSRSVFIIEKYEKEPDLFQGNQLHYGQKFRIRVNPRLINKSLYLTSLPTSPQRCAKFSRYQQVLMANQDNINTVWIAEHSDPKIRFESNNQPIPVNQPILIKHVLTQQWLGSDKINYSNIFGSENEVYAHSHQSHNKTQNLISEKCGRTTVDVPMRNQNIQNTWSFVSASDPSFQFDESLLDQSETASSLINKIRHILIQKGEYGFSGLLTCFKNMDRNQDKQLDADDFKWGLRNFGFAFNEQEIRLLLQTFDQNNNGFIDFNEFVQTLRGHEDNNRKGLIIAIFQSLQARAGGQLTYTEFIKQFQANRHPDAVKHFKTEREIFQSFVSYFGKRSPDHIVTLEEFDQFYSDISCSVDRDDIFEAIISNVWGFNK